MKHAKWRLWCLIAGCVLTAGSALLYGDGPRADLVLLNGKVITVDKDFSIRQAVAVKGDKILFTGTNREVKQYIGPGTHVIRLQGKLVLPGLIDAHAHLHSLGDQLSYLDITGTKSFDEIVARVARRVKSAKPGEWIIGGRWDQNDWADKKFPHHRALSKVSPDNPVYLRRVDGNSALANQKAMDIAGITPDSPKPYGGVIHKDKTGKPTGVLINRAMNLVKKHIPKDSDQQLEDKFRRAVQSCLAVGLTTGKTHDGSRPGSVFPQAQAG
jgi:predicted amidohydrolase YtcJ